MNVTSDTAIATLAPGATTAHSSDAASPVRATLEPFAAVVAALAARAATTQLTLLDDTGEGGAQEALPEDTNPDETLDEQGAAAASIWIVNVQRPAPPPPIELALALRPETKLTGVAPGSSAFTSASDIPVVLSGSAPTGPTGPLDTMPATYAAYSAGAPAWPARTPSPDRAPVVPEPVGTAGLATRDQSPPASGALDTTRPTTSLTPPTTQSAADQPARPANTDYLEMLGLLMVPPDRLRPRDATDPAPASLPVPPAAAAPAPGSAPEVAAAPVEAPAAVEPSTAGGAPERGAPVSVPEAAVVPLERGPRGTASLRSLGAAPGGEPADRRDTSEETIPTRIDGGAPLTAASMREAAIARHNPVAPSASEFADRLVTAARLSAEEGRPTRLLVRLDPPDLGQVAIEVTSRGSNVSIEVRAGHEGAAASIRTQQSTIQSVLKDAGFDLSGFDVDTRQPERDPSRQRPGRRLGARGTDAGLPGDAVLSPAAPDSALRL